MDLLTLKQSIELLRAAVVDAGGKLNPSTPKHNACPLCKDATGLSIFLDDKNLARWKCHAKCGGDGGTIVDLVMRARGLQSKEAVRYLLEKYGRQGSGVRDQGSGIGDRGLGGWVVGDRVGHGHGHVYGQR